MRYYPIFLLLQPLFILHNNKYERSSSRSSQNGHEILIKIALNRNITITEHEKKNKMQNRRTKGPRKFYNITYTLTHKRLYLISSALPPFTLLYSFVLYSATRRQKFKFPSFGRIQYKINNCDPFVKKMFYGQHELVDCEHPNIICATQIFVYLSFWLFARCSAYYMWLRDSVWLRERETLAAAAVTQQRRQFADNKKKIWYISCVFIVWEIWERAHCVGRMNFAIHNSQGDVKSERASEREWQEHFAQARNEIFYAILWKVRKTKKKVIFYIWTMHWGYLLCLILYFDLFVAYYSTVVELFMRARARAFTHTTVCVAWMKNWRRRNWQESTFHPTIIALFRFAANSSRPI